MLPEVLHSETWENADALREIIRGRLECLGPVTAERLAGELALPQSDVDQALLALQVEGFAFQGQFTPVSQAALAATGETPPTEWCERRLLQRIHRYTIDQHKKKIKPVSLAVFTEYLFEHQQLLPIRPDDHTLESGLDGQTRLYNTVNILDGSSAPAVSWESDITRPEFLTMNQHGLMRCVSAARWSGGDICYLHRKPPKNREGYQYSVNGVPVRQKYACQLTCQKQSGHLESAGRDPNC